MKGLCSYSCFHKRRNTVYRIAEYLLIDEMSVGEADPESASIGNLPGGTEFATNSKGRNHQAGKCK